MEAGSVGPRIDAPGMEAAVGRESSSRADRPQSAMAGARDVVSYILEFSRIPVRGLKSMETYPRRTFFNRMADGLFGAALAYLSDSDLLAANPTAAGPKLYDLKPKPPHHTP